MVVFVEFIIKKMINIISEMIMKVFVLFTIIYRVVQKKRSKFVSPV